MTDLEAGIRLILIAISVAAVIGSIAVLYATVRFWLDNKED